MEKNSTCAAAHHYQAFGSGENLTIYVFVKPSLLPAYYEKLQTCRPEYPILTKEHVHPDIVNALKALVNMKEMKPFLLQAYPQMILAHVFSEMPLVDKRAVGSQELIYNPVEYVAKNFRHKITLEKMACELGVNKFVLSRMFAKPFHCNFSRYVNDIRLNYTAAGLEETQTSITSICLTAALKAREPLTACLKNAIK